MSTYTKRINFLRVTVVNIYGSDILKNSLKFQVVNNIYVVIMYCLILATQRLSSKASKSHHVMHI